MRIIPLFEKTYAKILETLTMRLSSVDLENVLGIIFETQLIMLFQDTRRN